MILLWFLNLHFKKTLTPKHHYLIFIQFFCNNFRTFISKVQNILKNFIYKLKIQYEMNSIKTLNTKDYLTEIFTNP